MSSDVLSQINLRKSFINQEVMREKLLMRELNYFVVEELKKMGLDTKKIYKVSDDGVVNILDEKEKKEES